jgi:hypothetical protein
METYTSLKKGFNLMSRFEKKIYVIAVVCISLYWQVSAGIGQSAIITLSFPFGARTTGLGETFTGVANSIDALFYNPAGLGQAPLTNVWKTHLPVAGEEITAITAKQKKNAFGKERIWIGTKTKGLMLYNGKNWTSYDVYPLEENDELIGIVKRFIYSDDENLLKNALSILRKENKIESKRYNAIVDIIAPHLKDTINRSIKAQYLAETLLQLGKFNRTSAEVYGIIVKKVDSLSADSVSDNIAKAFSIEDKEFSELVELKIPFDIAINDTVTAMTLDNSERLWVGTKSKGIWRYDGASWKNYSILDGLPSNTITTLAAGRDQQIAAGTDNGAGLFTNGEWNAVTLNDNAASNAITALAFGKDSCLYIGTRTGLYKKTSLAAVVYDTTQGLFATAVTALFFDSQNKLWIGHNNGITVYDEIRWKRYRFENSTIYCFEEYKPGRIWIGTNKGAIAYKRGRVRTDKNGKLAEEAPEWKVYHSKNSLKGDDIRSITTHGKNLWLINENGVNEYKKGEIQVEGFYEPLLPAFNMPELWHVALAGIIPIEEWGTLGMYFSYLNFGKNEEYDANGRFKRAFNSYEFVLALAYGLQVKENLSIGFNLKYAHSALAPGQGAEGVARTFAFDAAILKRNLFIKNLSLGFTLMNMGPAVTYVKKDENDPIPFTARLGFSYTIVQTPAHNLLVALDFDREIVKKNPDAKSDPFFKAIVTELLFDSSETAREELEQVIVHIGIEYWYVNFIAFRLGYMHDEAGSRKEISFGIGLKYANMNADFSYIYATEAMSPARNGQWRFSYTYSY